MAIQDLLCNSRLIFLSHAVLFLFQIMNLKLTIFKKNYLSYCLAWGFQLQASSCWIWWDRIMNIGDKKGIIPSFILMSEGRALESQPPSLPLAQPLPQALSSPPSLCSPLSWSYSFLQVLLLAQRELFYSNTGSNVLLPMGVTSMHLRSRLLHHLMYIVGRLDKVPGL